MTYREEFPDYPEKDMPALPASLVDVSWHNDFCPCFESKLPNGRVVYLYIDYVNVELRECAEGARFTVSVTAQDDVNPAWSDSWSKDFESLEDALAYIETTMDYRE